jgi:hypothetical protein
MQTRPALIKKLRWSELPIETSELLARRLEGLYGNARDEEAFDSLAIDKQQALLILLRRLHELNLWESVHRVENVYGEGGVGMNFAAWPLLQATLKRRTDFTSLFANHGDTTGGFLERERKRASLHFLFVDEGARRWAVHFDLYNPWSSPLNAWRHLLNEKLKGETPDWRTIGASLWEGGG